MLRHLLDQMEDQCKHTIIICYSPNFILCTVDSLYYRYHPCFREGRGEKERERKKEREGGGGKVMYYMYLSVTGGLPGVGVHTSQRSSMPYLETLYALTVAIINQNGPGNVSPP